MSARYTWLAPEIWHMETPDEGNLWYGATFPSRDWYHLKDCNVGSECGYIPIAPSGRYAHTAIMYKTWTPMDAFSTICGAIPECYPYKDTCHRNLTCVAVHYGLYDS